MDVCLWSSFIGSFCPVDISFSGTRLWKAVPKFDAARGMKFLTYAAPAIYNAMMDMVRDAFTAFEQRMVTEDKDGVCYQRVSLDDVLPGEEQLRRIEAIADPYAMQPQSIMEEQESRRELYDGLKRLTQREQTYLLYRYGFTDGKEHPLIGTAIYFHLTKGRAQKTEEQAMDNLWLELPWWFIHMWYIISIKLKVKPIMASRSGFGSIHVFRKGHR